MDPAFRRASVYFDDIEYQRRFEQNLIRYGLVSGKQVTEEINKSVIATGGGGGGGGGGWCYWTKEGSNLAYYEGNVGVGCHPLSNDFEVRGNILVEAKEEQPYVEIRNWSDTAYDPVIHWSLGATSVKKFTMGVDDSDSDAWLLCSGDVLTSVVAAEEVNLSITYDGKLLVADTTNDRIKKHLSSDDMTYFLKIGSSGSEDDQFYAPWGICTDGFFVYVLDSSNHRVVKRLLSDFSYVSKIGSLGAGNDQFSTPRGMCTDGTYLYIADGGNDRVVKRLCADLSFVSKTDGTEGLNAPRSICTDGKYLYLFRYAGATYVRYKLLCSTLGLVQRELTDGQDVHTWAGMCYTGGFIYACTTTSIHKYTSGLGYVSEWGAAGTGDGQFTSAEGITTDGTYLWILDIGGIGGSQRIQKFLLDGTFVAKYGTYGSEDGQFYSPRGICISGTISGVTTTPYRAPILKAGLDGSYVDSYPVHRFRDQIRLMEDGVVGATKYIGINAPAAITASYDITFPAAVPGAQGHAAISTVGVVTWGQNVGTTGSPTFVRIVSLSQAIGTAPITVTSTTVCTNLNAGMVDGYHHDQSLLTTAGPSFDHVHLTIDIGTAPLVVTSTTMVANLNADLLDGSHAAAFAAAAHNHSGVYEPVLGNPGTDGWILSSTILGVRSWIAPGGGAGTFITLSDCPASYATHGGKFVKVNAGENALEFIASSVANHNLTSASHPDVNVTGLADNQILRYDTASGKWLNEDLPAASNHDLLSATHGDTLADTVVRGDLMIGNSTPKWARLAKGAAGTVLTMGASDPAWTAISAPVSVVYLTAQKTAADQTVWVDASGLAFTLVSGHHYKFSFFLVCQTQTTTRSLLTRFTAPAMTMSHWHINSRYGAAGTDAFWNSDQPDVTASLNPLQHAAANADFWYEVQGACIPSAGGTLQLQFTTEFTTNTVTLQLGSVGILYDCG